VDNTVEHASHSDIVVVSRIKLEKEFPAPLWDCNGSDAQAGSTGGTEKESLSV